MTGQTQARISYYHSLRDQYDAKFEINIDQRCSDGFSIKTQANI